MVRAYEGATRAARPALLRYRLKSLVKPAKAQRKKWQPTSSINVVVSGYGNL